VYLIVKFTGFLKRILPSPFSIAVILTWLTFLLALWLTPNQSESPHFLTLTSYWAKGFWELLTFSMQMMLILVLGYVLALTIPVNALINKLSTNITTTASAAFWVTLLTLVFGLLNWGLGLIFGAVFARKLAESFSARKLKFNYPLIGAAGYSGLIIWHGGLSGSAPLKVAETGHFLANKIGVIPLSETIFSTLNLSVSISLLIILPLIMFYLAKRSNDEFVHIELKAEENNKPVEISGADKLDHSRWFSMLLGLTFLVTAVYLAIHTGNLSFINLNFINFTLFTLGILLTPNIHTFTNHVSKSIGAASGILIQFPLYAGIMGIMKYSGLFLVFTDFFVGISNSTTLPLFTLISAGLVNFFVPSGGGQWAVQGPVIVEAARLLGTPVSKIIMALAYGDEWTNMLQPFWALPLLGITGLKAKEIVPYTFVLFLAGGVVFVIFLLLF
jgi:short-chain fatty acids transporter